MIGIWCDSRTKVFKTGWLHGWTFQCVTFDTIEAADRWLERAFKDDRVTYTAKAM